MNPPIVFLFFPERPTRILFLARAFFEFLDRLWIAFIFLLAILPGIGAFAGSVYVLRFFTSFAVEGGIILTMALLVALAGHMERYFRFFNRLSFTLFFLPPNQFARGRRGPNQAFRLDIPGFYVLYPGCLVYFMGDEEEWNRFDPLAL